MKLAVSNIAWKQEMDEEIYALMKTHGFEGVEIAPTRIVGEHPYEKSTKAKEWQEAIKEKYGFVIPSMQSLWYGKQERLFGDEKEQKELLLYTKKAIDFAADVTIDYAEKPKHGKLQILSSVAKVFKKRNKQNSQQIDAQPEKEKLPPHPTQEENNEN